ncbi:MAG: GlsB/YeaQ/YmgE family stress response membrane protein [Xanthobacteraceae bacterium]
MSGVGLIGALVIGILAGWIAEKVMSRNHGLLTNLIVGVVGSFVGAAVAGLLGFAYAGFLPSLVVSAGGAILFLFILDLVRGRSANRRWS